MLFLRPSDELVVPQSGQSPLELSLVTSMPGTSQSSASLDLLPGRLPGPARSLQSLPPLVCLLPLPLSRSSTALLAIRDMGVSLDPSSAVSMAGGSGLAAKVGVA